MNDSGFLIKNQKPPERGSCGHSFRCREEPPGRVHTQQDTERGEDKLESRGQQWSCDAGLVRQGTDTTF